MKTITSISNPLVKKYQKLDTKKHRDSEQLFIIEDEHLIIEAQKLNIIKEVLVLEDYALEYSYDNMTIVTKEVMRKLSKNTSLNKIIAICHFINQPIKANENYIILDNIQDPGNMGTIIRSALAFGYHNIIIGDDCVDIYNEKVLKATQGALFYINLSRLNLVEFITKLKDYQIICSDLSSHKLMEDIKITKKYALIFGNEGQGVKTEIINLSSETYKIAIEYESLNVSIATGISLYHFHKQ
ncbi:MAG: RNA methyltransferase [Erysipelotrichaceae bacterium]